MPEHVRTAIIEGEKRGRVLHLNAPLKQCLWLLRCSTTWCGWTATVWLLLTRNSSVLWTTILDEASKECISLLLVSKGTWVHWWRCISNNPCVSDDASYLFVKNTANSLNEEFSTAWTVHCNLTFVGGVVINVECKAWAQNINHDGEEKEAMVNFELLIE